MRAEVTPVEPWRSFLADLDGLLKGPVELRCLGGDGHFLDHLADLQTDVDHFALRDRQGQILHHRRLKAGRLGRDLVPSGRQLRQNVPAVLAGLRLSRETCGELGYGNRSGGDDAAALVGDDPRDG